VATIKRIETGSAASLNTLKNYSTFFQIPPQSLLLEPQYDGAFSTSKPSASLIIWDIACSLSGSEEKDKLANLCKELHYLLLHSSNDEELKSAFRHHNNV